MTNKNTLSLLTDEALIGEFGSKIKQVRLRRNLTQTELALESGVAKRTIERFEKGASIQVTSLVRILRVLGLVDILLKLIPNEENNPMAQLVGEKKTRYRASKRSSEAATDAWTWKD